MGIVKDQIKRARSSGMVGVFHPWDFVSNVELEVF